MDPFDEFEIKPLSDGLGFHKKSTPLSEQMKKSGLLADQALKVPSQMPGQTAAVYPSQRPQSFDEILKALEAPVGSKARAAASAELNITEPLPSRTPATPNVPSKPTPAPTPNVRAKDTQATLTKVVENVGLKRGAADSPMRLLEKASVAISSAILDGVMVLALTLIFLVVLMTVTKVDLAALVFQVGLDIPTKIAFAALFVSVMLMYVVVSRAFFGRTLGEWTFDFQMGDDKQQKSALYPLQVLWRSVLVTMTGVVLVPTLSLLFGRDLLAPLTGVQLYRQK